MNAPAPLRACALMLMSVTVLAGCGSSAVPGLSGNTPEPPPYSESWTGGPFDGVSNPLVNHSPIDSCLAQAEGTPVCDYHQITPPAGATGLAVSMHAAAGFEADDYDLYVYDDKGTLVGSSASEGANERAVFATNGAAYYQVRVQPYTISPGSGYEAVATESSLVVDAEPECSDGLLGEEYPEYVGISGVTDDGHEVELSAAVLLDGVSEDLARRVMARAADAYSPLNIKLTIAGIQTVEIKSSVSTEMITEAKELTLGTPPFGADIVTVFTTKEMQAATGGAGTVLGQADCIGGIRAPYNSYLVATIGEESPFDLAGGFALDREVGPETMAHEIGHLMGAHHHYGNCLEGASPDDVAAGDVSPCDLMFPSVEPLSLTFATLPAVTVRGHAVEFAETR